MPDYRFITSSGDDESSCESSPSPSDDSHGLSEFRAKYTIPLQCLYPKSDGGLLTQINHPSSDDPELVPDSPNPSEINQKLIFLFDALRLYPFEVLIQFWSIVKTDNRCLLATYEQPFVVNLDSGLQKYRLRSKEYRYNVDPNYNLEVEGEDPFIINGAPSNVFRSHLAEVIIDLRVHHGSPLVRCALECGVISCFLIPICDVSQSRCVGVLECCFKEFDRLIQTSYQLLPSIEKASLRMFKVQKDLLYKAIGSLEGKYDEISRALHKIRESQHLTLAQVSIGYEDVNLLKRIVPLTLTMQSSTDKGLLCDYCDYCDMFPVKIMDGLAGKALENYESHFCRNIYKMSNIEQPATITMEKLSCLVICLKSNSISCNVDYVFEFLWPRERCYLTMIERLILTLKRCLPNFKFACGAEFGDELRVIKVDNLSKSGIQTTFEFFKGEKSSPIPTLFKEGRKKEGKGKTHEISLTLHHIEQQYGRTMEEAATNLNVSKSTLKRKWRGLNIGSWRGPKRGKRKVNNFSKDQTDINEGDNRITLASLAVSVNTVTIKAEYQNDLIKFRLPLSSITFEAVEKEIGEKLKLNAGSFKLKYCDEDGDWILLVSDQDMRDCIKSFRSLNNTTIRLRVT